MLSWRDGNRFAIGGTSFRAVPDEAAESDELLAIAQRVQDDLGDDEFFVFKFRAEIDAYAELLDRLQPLHIFELGIHSGGSSILFAELTRPEKLVAVDLEPMPDVRERIEARASASGLGDAVRAFGGVDQGDRAELARIAAGEFGDAGLDFVVDDCSHLYEPTRESFNELFPRLRAGGVYVIEDWRWGHTPLGQEARADWEPEVPLSRLVVEIVLASATVPGLASDIAVEPNGVTITRGDADVDADTFDVSTLAERPAAAPSKTPMGPKTARSRRAGSRWFPRRSG